MSRPQRFVPEGDALAEITINMIQGRYLLRPDRRGRVNELVLGVVGRAQGLYSISIVGISVLSCSDPRSSSPRVVVQSDQRTSPVVESADLG